jgi:outer membrane protein OmpA-like peptidoglycan-associated protein
VAVSFLSAVLHRQPQVLSALLDEKATVRIPSLGFTCSGRAETIAALGSVLSALSDLRYDVRHRYLAPGTLIDEVLLTARRHGHLLGRPPDDQPLRLSARIQLDHNGSAITSLVLWADRQALHELLRTSDPGRTGILSVVSALRATMPEENARLTVGNSRQLPLLPPGPGGTDSGSGSAPGDRIPAPRPRRHRLRPWGIGTAALLTGLFLATGVVRAVLTDPTASAPVATPTTSSTVVSPVSSDSLPDGVTYSRHTRSYDLSSDVLFAPDSTELTSRAREVLDAVVLQVRHARPSGVITVTGYTDTTGSASYNRALSDRRARAVAEALATGLSDLPDLDIDPHGAGETGTAEDNDTVREREANRRVTVTLPAPTDTAAGAL